MLTAAICLDTWKRPVFESRLRGAGFDWTEHPGITADTITFKVKTESIAALQKVLEAAQRECKTWKNRKPN